MSCLLRCKTLIIVCISCYPLNEAQSTTNLLRERGHNFELYEYNCKFLGSLLW